MATPRFGTIIDKAILYHGGPVSGITKFHLDKFDRLGNRTLGEGIYFASRMDCAEGYARLRAGQFRMVDPTVYTAEITGASFVDFRVQETRTTVLSGFADHLVGLIGVLKGDFPPPGSQGSIADTFHNLNPSARNRSLRMYCDALELIRKNPEPQHIRDVLDRSTGQMVAETFSIFLKETGNHGLIAPEGTDWFSGTFDTWLVFEHYPNLRIIAEKRIG